MNHERETEEAETLDHGDFGNTAAQFSNRFHMFVGSSMSRIYFGDQIVKDGEVLFHTSIVMHTADLIELRELINRLLPDNGDSFDSSRDQEG